MIYIYLYYKLNLYNKNLWNRLSVGGMDFCTLKSNMPNES